METHKIMEEVNNTTPLVVATEKIKVMIEANGTCAREVNGREYPDSTDPLYYAKRQAYQDAAASLRTFVINSIKGLSPLYIKSVVPKLLDVGAGTIHLAEVIEIYKHPLTGIHGVINIL